MPRGANIIDGLCAAVQGFTSSSVLYAGELALLVVDGFVLYTRPLRLQWVNRTTNAIQLLVHLRLMPRSVNSADGLSAGAMFYEAPCLLCG